MFQLSYFSHYIIFFFFQAEDGIRDIGVTGVQTCALPISLPVLASPNCSTLYSGCAFWAAAVAARIGSTLSWAFSVAALTSKYTTDEWPSREIWPSLPLLYGPSMLVTSFWAARRPSTSLTTAR